MDGKIYFKIHDNENLNAQSNNGVVDFNKVSFLSSVASYYGISKLNAQFYNIKDIKLQKTYLLEFNNYAKIDEFISYLKGIPSIEYAEKKPIFHLFYTPNDPYYGTVTSGLASANAKWHLDKISAGQAWDISKGSVKVKVAVLDNAIWAQHPDLAGKIVLKYDLADNDTNTNPPTTDYSWSHGTHTSGLVGAKSDNGVGVASIGYNVSLMAGKVGRDSDGALVAGYEGILWAADNGADVISMSWGSYAYMQTMQNIINYAYNLGCVLVAAAGNDGADTLNYPAALDHVISVAMTDEDDKANSMSNYGTTVDVCAPGGMCNSSTQGMFSVLSTTYCDASYNIIMGGAKLFGVNGKYEIMAGTSMACPIAAGLCGLMLSVDSTLTPEKLEHLLKLGCDDIYPVNDTIYIGKLGAGRINAYHTLQIVQDSTKILTANFMADNIAVIAGTSINFSDLSIGNPNKWKWHFQGATPDTSSAQNPTNIKYMSPGIYPVTLTVYSSPSDSNTEIKTNFIIVKKLPSGAWKTQATGFTAPSRGILDVCIVDNTTAWATAYDGSGSGVSVLEFTRTKDSGNLWTPSTITGVPTGAGVSQIFAINYDTAYAGFYYTNNTTTGQTVYKTIDGGANWTAQPTAEFSSTSAFINVIHFFDNTNGVCIGDPNGGYWEIYTTSDGGNNWVRVPQADIPANISGEYGYNGGGDYYVKGNTIWFGTNKGWVYKSTDKGLHWTKYASGCDEVSGMTFSDESNGILEYITFNQTTGAITHFEMKSTIDGGETWQTLTPQGDYFKNDISAVPGKPGMYISTGSSQDLALCGSAFSLDYGYSWTKIDDSVQYTCVKFYDYNTGWAGGFNQSATAEGIWKWMGLIQDDKSIIADFYADRLTITEGDSINFTDASLGNVLTYQWTFAGGTPASSAVQAPPFIKYNTAGNYAVTLVASNTDTSVTKTKTAYIHVQSGASVKNIDNYNEFIIFPNPSNGIINIKFNNSLNKNYDINIYNVIGSKVFVENNINANSQLKILNLSKLNKGIYFIEISAENYKGRKKIIIE